MPRAAFPRVLGLDARLAPSTVSATVVAIEHEEELMVETRTDEGYALEKDAGVIDLWFPYGPVLGRYSMKVTGEQSDGRLFQVHVTDERGAASPLHIHHNGDESFYVIDGEMTFFIGDEKMDVGAGSFALMPKGVRHAFLVRSERAEFLITFAPAGLEGFFSEVGVPVVPGQPKPVPTPVDPEEMNRKAAAYGVEIVGPPPTLD